MKADGGAGQKINVNLEQGKPTQRVATASRHHHIDKLSGDTYQPLHSPKSTKKKVRGRGKLPQKFKIWSS